MRTRLLGALLAALLIAQPAFAQVMKLHPAAGSAAPVLATFVSASQVTLGSGGVQNISIPTGGANGDLLVVWINNGGSTGASAITINGTSRSLVQQMTDQGARSAYFISLDYIALQAADLNGTIALPAAVVTGAQIAMTIYHGPSTVANRGGVNNGSTNATTLTVTGYTPAVNSAGAVAWLSEDFGASGNASPSATTGWVFRLSNQPGSAFFAVSLPDKFAYAGGADTFTGFVSTIGSSNPFGVLAELLN